MTWLVRSLARLREAQSHTVALALIVIATAFATVAMPRFVSGTGDRLLRETLTSARSDVRDITFIQEGRIGAVLDGPLDQVDAALEHVLVDVPVGLAAVLEPPRAVIDTSRWVIVGRGPAETTVRLRFQPGADEHVRLTEGALPTERISVAPRDDDPEGAKPPVTFVEAALSAESAGRLGASIGDRVVLELDRTDRLSVRQVSVMVRYDNRTDARVGIVVAGIFEVADPEARFWFDDPALERPVIRSIGGDTRFQDVTVLVAPEAYPAFIAATETSGVPLRYTWRLAVADDRVHTDHVAALLDDMRRLETIFPSAGAPLSLPNASALRSGLSPLLRGFVAAWGSVEAVLAVVLMGAATIALAALALTVVLLARRRRSTMDAYRRRGASGRQIAGTAALEGLVIAAPAAAIGALLAVAVLPAGSDPVPLAAAIVVIVATLMVVLAPTRDRPAVAGGRPGRAWRADAGKRRILLEGALVIVAGLAAYLARERGLATASSARDLVGTDPLVAAAPALVGLAAGVVAQRLFPVPARLLAWLAARRRYLVPSLAMRRLARGSASGTVLIVLLAASAVAAFAAATLARVDGLAAAVAADAVGAPYRIDVRAGLLAPGMDPLRLPGVTAAAVAFSAPGSLANGTPVGVLAIDPSATATVLSDAETGGIPGELAGEAQRPVPAIVSANLGERPMSLELGDTFSMTVAGYATTYRVVGLREAFPSMGDVARFVVVARPQLEAALPSARIGSNRVLLNAPAEAGPALRAALTEADPAAVLIGRAELAEAIRNAPAVAALRDGISAAALMTALFAAAAVTIALVMLGAGEAVQIAQLRALGLTRGQTAQLLILEQAPTVVLAFGVGVALGLGLFVLLLPGLTLETVVGGRVEIPFSIDPGSLGLTFVGTALIVAVGLAIATAIQRTAAPASAIRQAVDG